MYMVQHIQPSTRFRLIQQPRKPGLGRRPHSANVNLDTCCGFDRCSGSDFSPATFSKSQERYLLKEYFFEEVLSNCLLLVLICLFIS